MIETIGRIINIIGDVIYSLAMWGLWAIVIYAIYTLIRHLLNRRRLKNEFKE